MFFPSLFNSPHPLPNAHFCRRSLKFPRIRPFAGWLVEILHPAGEPGSYRYMSPEEISGMLDMPVATVKSHLQRTLRLLREKSARVLR